MAFNPITDDPLDDTRFPAASAAVKVISHGARCNGIIYIAQGAGPHPTILLLHGLPGHERNFDLAQILRRAGYNVMVFHYRGSWGSQGEYSFTHVLEDAHSALEFLRGERTREAYRVDVSRLILVGHSLGAFAALTTSATDAQIRATVSLALFDLGAGALLVRETETARATMLEFFESCLSPLIGTSAQSLLNEMVANGEGWYLPNKADALALHKLLLIDAALDTLAVPSQHHLPLAHALRERAAQHLTHIALEADHAFNQKRVALARTIVEWLEQNAK